MTHSVPCCHAALESGSFTTVDRWDATGSGGMPRGPVVGDLVRGAASSVAWRDHCMETQRAWASNAQGLRGDAAATCRCAGRSEELCSGFELGHPLQPLSRSAETEFTLALLTSEFCESRTACHLGGGKSGAPLPGDPRLPPIFEVLQDCLVRDAVWTGPVSKP